MVKDASKLYSRCLCIIDTYVYTSKILKVFVTIVGGLYLANFIHKNMNLRERDRSYV